MNDLEKAARMALEALIHLQPTALTSFYTIGDRDKAITALRQAISDSVEQPAQQSAERVEPVDWEAVAADQAMTIAMMKAERKPWTGLTDDELRDAYGKVSGDEWCLGGMSNAESFYEAIEAKLREKNT